MKTFYTERDIEEMYTAGVLEIEIDQNVILTDLAREKALALDIRLTSVEKRSTIASPPSAPQTTPNSVLKDEVSPSNNTAIIAQVKAAVIARLGTTKYNMLLDQVIPQVLAQFTITSQPSSSSASAPSDDSY